MKRFVTTLVMFLMTFVILTACSGGTEPTGSNTGGPATGASPNAGPAESDTIKIGVTYAFSGPAAISGEQSKRGTDLAMEMVNEKGGVLGKQLELIYEDDQGNPEVGANALRKLIERDKVKFTIGGIQSAVSMAQKEVAREAGILQMVTVSKAPAIVDEGHDLLFRFNSSSNMDKEFYPEFLSNQGLKRVALIVEQTDYGQAEEKAITEAWKASGKTEVVAIERIQNTATDFSVELTKIRSLNPDAILLITSPPNTVAAIAMQAKELGITSTIALGLGTLTEDHIKLAGEASEGILSADTYVWDMEYEENQEFVNRFEAKYNIKPNKYEVYAYDAVILIAQAMEKAQSDDPVKVAQVLKDGEWRTPSGVMTFNEKGQNMQDGYVGVRVEGGKIVSF